MLRPWTRIPELRQAIGATWFGAGIPAPSLEGDPEFSAAVHRQALDAVARRLLAALQQLMDLREDQGAGAGSGPWPL